MNGKELREMRESLKMPRSVFAPLLRIGEGTLWKIENGHPTEARPFLDGLEVRAAQAAADHHATRRERAQALRDSRKDGDEEKQRSRDVRRERFLRLRAALGMTQGEFGAVMGVQPNTICALEKGRFAWPSIYDNCTPRLEMWLRKRMESHLAALAAYGKEAAL